jgi:carbamoyl-phosphate synthase large subunit
MIKKHRPKVLIAGIGGASLGTELLKCLLLVDRYDLFGCDVSNLAYGHYQSGFRKTFLVDPGNYIQSVLSVSVAEGIDFIIPGGEEPLLLLSDASELFIKQGIRLISNSKNVVNNFTDKERTFQILTNLGFTVPLTKLVRKDDDLDQLAYPCVIKPAKGSGGSAFVFVAQDCDEARIYTDYLRRNEKIPLAQEYIPLKDGEFSFGTVAFPEEGFIASIAMKRTFPSKLSIHAKSSSWLISSPYGQGFIGEFSEERAAAERIAAAIGSIGPLNIQGRFKNGCFVPFELNPRFSGSSYLRALAGLNEPDLCLRHELGQAMEVPVDYRCGYFLRSLSEVYIPKKGLKT